VAVGFSNSKVEPFFLLTVVLSCEDQTGLQLNISQSDRSKKQRISPSSRKLPDRFTTARILPPHSFHV